MNNTTRSGFFFGITMAITFTLLNLAFDKPQTSAEIQRAILNGVITGAVAGLLFGLSTKWFLRSKIVNSSTRISLQPGEKILFQSGANHFKGIEGVGGKLYLTNKRLVFKSHRMNIQNHEWSLMNHEIKKVTPYKSAGLLDNGLLIRSISGQEEKFVVEQRDKWLTCFSEMNDTYVKREA